MAKKPLGVDKMGIQKTMRTTDYLADCGGQFALNAMTGLVSAVLYFYTEKVGVAAPRASAARGSCVWRSRRLSPLWRCSPYPPG